MNLSYTVAIILQALEREYQYGFDIMEVTGLPSGTVYPALRRLEAAGLIRSEWENEKVARNAQRPARKYYVLTKDGKNALSEALTRYRGIERLLPEQP